MAYFIHNKYDKNSSAKVTSSGGLNYTYNDDPSVTVIDYYGNLEQGIDTYKYLDTTYMGTQVIDSLTYSTIDEGNLIGKNQTTDGNSGINYASGVLPIVEKVQELIGVTSDTGGSESLGTIMAKLNESLNRLTKLAEPQVSTTGFGNTIFEYTNKLSARRNRAPVIAKFIAPISGLYNIKFHTKYSRNNQTSDCDLYKMENYTSLNQTGSSSYAKGCNLAFLYNKFSVGTFIEDEVSYDSYNYNLTPFTVNTSSAGEDQNILIYCTQGEPVIIFAVGGNSSYYEEISKIKITYGNE